MINVRFATIKLLSLLAIGLSSCAVTSYLPGGRGTPSTKLIGTNGSVIRNISFQCIGSEWGTPAILALPEGGLVACQMITPTEYRLQRLDDTLGTIWATQIAVPEEAQRFYSIFGGWCYTLPADLPLRLSRSGDNLIMLGYRVSSEDSMFLVRRMFSLTTGAMQEETIVHRAKPLDDVDYPSGQYSIATSPDSSYSIVGIMTGVKGTSRKLEVVLLGKDLSVIATRSVTFTPARKGDVFRSMLIDNQGDLFITSVDPKATLTVTKQSMLDGPEESRLSATIPAPADEIPDTLGTYARVEDNNTIRIIRAYSIHNRLVGISVTKFDFGRDYVPVNTFTAVQDSTIRQIFGDVSTFEYAAFHSCLTTSTDTAFTLLFEQRIGISRTSWLGKFPNLDNGCRAGNVLMLGIDGVGALRWRQGFRKDQASRYASFAGISFETRATSHNTVQYFYRSGMKIVVREYRATDGESVDGGKEHEVLILPSLVLLRGAYPMLSTSTWLNDRSFVFSTFMHEEVGFYDMKLVKVDY